MALHEPSLLLLLLVRPQVRILVAHHLLATDLVGRGIGVKLVNTSDSHETIH